MAGRAALSRKADRVVFCSVATPSHVGQALASLRSFGERAPGAQLVLLLVSSPMVLELPGITVLPVADCVEARAFKAMRARYSDPELCFALKPYLLLRLLAQDHDQVHYVDGDCHAFGDVALLCSDLAAADLLLTPHSLSPIPDDGRTPRALTVLRAGVFNGGYIGARPTPAGLSFLRWLASMTLDRARNAPAEGMCGDQRWLDLAPVLLPGLSICRRLGANVGYWNLHERRLTVDAQGRFRVNDERLMFFHFSGYDLTRPERLSSHQNRHVLEADSALALLLRCYHEKRVEADVLLAAGSPRKPRGEGRFAGLQAILGAAITEEKR